MFNLIIYVITLILVLFSFFKDKKKTIKALQIAIKCFKKILLQFLGILLLINSILEILNPEIIQSIIGKQSELLGMIIAGAIGSVTIIPALIAFPITSRLLNNGAGLVQIIVFISTLTTVGIATMPLESKYLGKKVTILRRVLFFIFSFIVAYVSGVVLSWKIFYRSGFTMKNILKINGGRDAVGMGVLLGLNMYKYDFVGLLMHAEHLEAARGVSPHTIRKTWF